SQGAAARIKKDEADAQARRQAVRYLGTVDCSRWPEAEAALINALRGDRNECVRLEAALALRNGCCCTVKIRRALEMTIIGKADKFPPERSERVKAAAADALAHCPPEEEIFEGPAPIPETIKKASLQQAMNHYTSPPAPMQTVETMPNSRGLLVLMQQRFAVQTANASMPTANSPYHRPGSLSGIVATALSGRPEYTPPPPPVRDTRPITTAENRPIAPMPTAPTNVDWRPASQLPRGPIATFATPTTLGQPRESSGWVTIEPGRP
ncbi:MAG TPA: HEAT repeat domain-containing protein, partial [Gemmataceae bacterium]|nr:HEAT repeat domain-containing protein [Gemmataceae bacterium]